jgi:Leucine-rich repeat (LRR) protein
LERLDLGDNSLTALPEELSCCSKLTRLHCYGNKLADLPEQWKALTSLVDVSFRWNKLSKVPEFLLSTSKLEILDLSGNPMTDFGASGSDLAAAWPRLRKLNLYACKISSLPDEFLSKKLLPHLASILIGRTPMVDTVPPQNLPQHLLDPLAGSPPVATVRPPNSNREIISDRIRGCIYGNAIGDALGLASEFTRADMAKHFYGYLPGGISYADILRDDHRFNWIPGDWTDDTDQMLLILDSIFEKNVRIPEHVSIISWSHCFSLLHLHYFREVK